MMSRPLHRELLTILGRCFEAGEHSSAEVRGRAAGQKMGHAIVFTAKATGPLAVVLATIPNSPTHGRDGYESYFLYATDENGQDYPAFEATSWGSPHNATNGIAHDDNNWYFTGQDTDLLSRSAPPWKVWRIPAGIPLTEPDLEGDSRVTVKYLISDYEDLEILGYDHAGDIDYYPYPHEDRSGEDQTGYLVLPLTGGDDGPALAFLDAPSLNYVGLSILDQDDIGWCTSPDFVPGEPGSESRYIYTSEDFTSTIERYPIDWDALTAAGPPATLESDEFYNLGPVEGDSWHPSCERYGQSYELCSMQGGQFSASGELLYVSSGVMTFSIFGDDYGEMHQYDSDGLHVFEIAPGSKTWPEVKRSENLLRRDWRVDPLSCCPWEPDLEFTFENNINVNLAGLSGLGQEPEGLTIWDLDDADVYTIDGQPIDGQLHVLVFDYKVGGDEKVAIKHYTNRVYVDGDAPPWMCQDICTGVSQFLNPIRGTSGTPFNTVRDGVDRVAGWDGGEVVLRAGSYAEIGLFDTKVRLVSEGGPATIGE